MKQTLLLFTRTLIYSLATSSSPKPCATLFLDFPFWLAPQWLMNMLGHYDDGKNSHTHTFIWLSRSFLWKELHCLRKCMRCSAKRENRFYLRLTLQQGLSLKAINYLMRTRLYWTSAQQRRSPTKNGSNITEPERDRHTEGLPSWWESCSRQADSYSVTTMFMPQLCILTLT